MKNSFLFLCISLVLGSCVVSKPDAGLVGNPDYNQRISVDGAHYKRRVTVAGTASVIAGAVAGGYLGHSQNWIMRQDGDIRQPVKPANAALGAFAGFAVTNLALHVLGKNKVKSCNDATAWLKQANRNYLIYQKKQPEQNFIVIPRLAEESYSVRNFEDAKGFYRTFPGSSRKEDIFKQAIPVINRAEIPELMGLSPGSRHTLEAKLRYCELSKSISELLEAKRNYPEVKFPFEERAASLCATLADVELFRNEFGTNSSHNDGIFEKTYTALPFDDLVRLIAFYPNAAKVKEAKTLAISKCPDLTALERLKDIWYEDFKKEMYDKGADLILSNLITAITNLPTYKSLFPTSSWLHANGDSLYLGGWKNNRPQGTGIWQFAPGEYEYGSYKDGKLEGSGKRVSGTYYYEGEFINGLYHGFGTEYSPGYFTYKGQFRFGEKDGKGTSCGIYPAKRYFPGCECDYACYEGDWSNDNPNGSGRWATQDNSTWYAGGYKDGRLHGRGEIRMPSGVRIIGNYKDSEPSGDIKLMWWTLGGLVSKQQIVYGADSWDDLNTGLEKLAGNVPGIFSDDDTPPSSSPSSDNCIKDLQELENYDEYEFRFSGKDYMPASSNWLYGITCNDGTDGFLVFLSYDTYAEEWYNFDWKKGWYFYEDGWLNANDKHGPYKTLEEAKKETCSCD